MTKPKEAQLDLLLKISEGLSKRSYEMLQVSPTDAIHAPSCGLAIRDAVDELRWMRAENERLHKAHQAVCEGWDLLREKNERLRAQMQQIRERLYLAAGHAAAAALLSEEAHRRALEGKP